MIEKKLAATAALVLVAACSIPIPGGTTSSSGRAPAESAGETASGGASEPGASTAPGSDSAKPYAGADAAHLQIRLVDAPTDEVAAIVVTVAKVDALIGETWTTLVDRASTVDLLTLQDGKFLALGMASLPPGRVGQLRLRLAEGGDHHVVTPDGESHPLVIPSGETTGIKLVGGFDVPPCATGYVTIDFDGKRSLQLITHGNPASSASEWKLRPVVKLKAIVAGGECAADGGAEDAGTTPPSEPVDPCAEVACAESEVCDNGACRPTE